MNARLLSIVAPTLVIVTLAGCGQDAATGSAMPAGAMEQSAGMQLPTDAAEHVATGIVNALDTAAGQVDITHEPVPALNWPAMTMRFQLADPALAQQLVPGQQIEFRFTTENGGTVTGLVGE